MTLPARLFLLFGITLFCLAPVARGQDTTIEQSSTDHSTKIEAHLEKKYTVKLELTPPPTRRCHVRVTMDYLQKNDVAKVDSMLENEDCAASSGSYTVSIRYRDQNNEQQRVEYDETWEREDDQPLTITKDYFAGKNVDITRVQPKNLTCLCAEELPMDDE